MLAEGWPESPGAMAETTEMAESQPPRQLTPAIERALRRLDRRLRMVATLRGLGTLMLALAACLALGMAVDFAWDAPEWARHAARVAGVAALATIPIRTLAHVFMRKHGSLALAALAERSDPALGDRLTAAVDLLLRPAGSPALVRATVADAESRAGAVDARRAVPARAARRRFLAGTLALAPLLGAACLAPASIGVLLLRALAPRPDLQRISRFVVEVTPGDRVVALDDDVPVTARVAPRFGGDTPPDEAWLEWTGPTGGNPRRARMVPDRSRPGHFSGTFPASMPSNGYRVRSGPAASRRHEIRGVEPPAIAGLTATVRPPAYTGRPTTTARDVARIVAFEGSTVTLSLETGAALATLTRHGAPPRSFTRATAGTPFRIDILADESGPYSIGLVDASGIRGRPGPARHLTVEPDEPPTAVAHGPADGARARPDDVLAVRLAAADDVAVASAELHVEVRRGTPGKSPSNAQMPIDLERVAAEVRGRVLLRLAPLGLAPGDVVACRVRVADNRPPPRGPNVTWADLPPVTITEGAEPLGLQAGRRRRDATRGRIEALARDAATARVEVEQLRYAADAVARGNGRWDDARRDDLARRTRDVAALAEHLRALAGDLEHDDDARFAPLAPRARGVAEAQAEPGRDRLERAGRSTVPESRLDELRRADAHLAAARAGLDGLRRDFDELARDDADRDALARLAEVQDALADRAGDLAKHQGPAPAGNLDRLKAEQEALGRDVDGLLAQSPTLRAELLTGQIKEAGALADRAKELARRNAESPSESRPQAAEAARVLARDAEQVGRSLDDLADRSKDLSPRSREPSKAAAKQLGRDAPSALNKAADALAGDRPDEAVEARRKAGEALDGGARKAAELAGSLQADYPELNIAEPDARVDPALAGAREALRSASRKFETAPDDHDPAGTSGAARAAEPAMRQAALGLRAAAQAPRPAAASPTGPASLSAGKSAATAGIAAPDLSPLPALARRKAGRDWGGLPPHLRAALLGQGARGGYRDDYERLIRLYFREVAADPR
jgi:hypothetical protein